MIAHVYYQLRLLIACWRFRYWSKIIAGQRRVWHASHPDDSARLLAALQDRSRFRAKAAETWQ